MINNVSGNVDRYSMGSDTTEAWDSRYFSKKRNFDFENMQFPTKISTSQSPLDVCIAPIYICISL